MTTDLLTRDSLAEQRRGVWDYVSPSRLNLWLKCPLAFPAPQLFFRADPMAAIESS